jgi:hypothetical protein
VNDIETRLTQHLHATAANAVPAPDLDAVKTGRTVVGLDHRPGMPRRRGRTMQMIAAAAALMIVAGTVGFLTTRDSDSTRNPPVTQPPTTAATSTTAVTTPPPASPEGFPVRWATQRARLSADDLAITVGGKTFRPGRVEVVVDDDGGSGESQTLELTWIENNVEMRWYIYLQSDGSEWWSAEMTTYDGRRDGDWVSFTGGDYFRSPLGQAFRGDLSLESTGGGVTSHIEASGFEIQAFIDDAAPSTATTRGTATGTSGELPPSPVDWVAPHVRLSADDFAVIIDGERFSGADAEVDSKSSASGLTRLTATWRRGGVETRWTAWLWRGDGPSWGWEKMSVARGPLGQETEYLLFAGDYVDAQIGEVFTGDVTATETETESAPGVTGRVEIRGLELELLPR